MAEITFVLVVLPFVLAVCGYSLRFVARHVLRNSRERRIGALVWVRMVSRGAPPQDRQQGGYGPAAFMTLKSLVDHTAKSSFLEYHRRGVVSAVWLRNPNTQMIDLYIGMDETHYGDGQAIRSAARRLDASVEELEGPPDVPTEAVVTAFRRRVTPSDVVRQLDTSGGMALSLSSAWNDMQEGESAALVLTMDMMRNSEGQRFESNTAEEGKMRAGETSIYTVVTQAAKTMADSGVRVSVAASNSSGDVRLSESTLNQGLRGVSSLAWDFRTMTPEHSHRRSTLWLGLGASAVLSVLALVLSGVVSPFVGFPTALLPLLVSFAVRYREDWFVRDWVRSRIARGEIVVPPFMWWSLRYFVQAVWRSNRSDGGNSQEKVGNRIAPPSCKQVLIMYSTSLFEALSFPPSELATDIAVSSSLNLGLPAGMVDVPHGGLFIGMSGKDQPVLYDVRDLNHSVYVAGSPSSGKSNMMLAIYAGVVRAAWEQLNGLSITPMWVETKGEGAYDAWRIASNNPDAIFLDANNAANPYRLALEGPRLSDGATVDQIRYNVAQLVSGMQTAYGEGIGPQARELADAFFLISMLLTPDEIRFLELDEVVWAERPNIVYLTSYLTGTDNRIDPTTKLVRLQEDLDMSDERERLLSDSISIVARFVGPKSQRSAGERLSAVLNKLNDFRKVPLMWEPRPERQDVYVGQLLTSFVPVVLNLGSHLNEQTGQFSNLVDGQTSEKMTRIVHHQIWKYVDSHCAGWEDMGRRIMLFFDEVSDVATVASGAENTLEDGTKQGRSRGLGYVLGCQSPDQLPHEARKMVLAFRTKFWFNMHKEEDLQIAVRDLTTGDRASANLITQSSVRRLPNGTSMGIMKRLGTVSPPFTLQVPEARSWAKHLFASATVGDALADYYEERAAIEARSKEAAVVPRR